MSFTRRMMSLLAAYAVALQLLLLPLGVAAGAALPGAHCAPEGPAQHQSDTGLCCAVGCGALCQHHVLAAPGAAALPEPVPAFHAARFSAALEQAAGPVAVRPVWARGPPRVGRA